MNDPHTPLRENVKWLGKALGEVLQQLEGQALYALVENIRQLAKAARASEGGGVSENVHAVLAALPEDKLLKVARAFSLFLNLANLAEQYHRLRRSKFYTNMDPLAPQPGSLEETLPRLLNRGVDQDSLKKAIENLEIGLVFTAHPTEVMRRTLMQKFDKINELLGDLDEAGPDIVARRRVEEALKREITTIWLTPEIRPKNPTPLDEARWGLMLVEQVLWQAYPAFVRNLEDITQRLLGASLPQTFAPIRFGSWMGGDRDGNPSVTAEVTQQVVWQNRWLAAFLYHKEIDTLRAELSLAVCDDTLRAQVGEASEPYRAFLKPVRDRLQATQAYYARCLSEGEQPIAKDIYLQNQEFLQPLLMCYQSLVKSGAELVARGRLLDVIRKVHAFGLSLFRLDIRQESELHREAIAYLMERLPLFSHNQDDWLLAALTGRLRVSASLLQEWMMSFPPSDNVRTVLTTFAMMTKLPRESFGAYVISMAHNENDVLHVVALQTLFGVDPILPVVPLFETEDDLKRAPEILSVLFSMPVYRAVLAESIQEVMIGYSDSAKDVGQCAASWAQYQAQETIIKVGQLAGVRIRLFHGRGGTVGRGGAPTHMAILSQPPGALAAGFRVTEQGEVIRHKFGLPEIALRTLEIYASATLEGQLCPPYAPLPAWREVMDDLAVNSKNSFRAMVYDNKRFLKFFQRVTPIEALSQMAMGSRPAKRHAVDDIRHLRAIPWIFAWTQNRLMLPVWLGFDEALNKELKKQKSTLHEMYEGWPFFFSMIDMIEMVLAKADEHIARHYEVGLTDVADIELGEGLRARLQVAIEAVFAVTRHSELLESNPTMKRSIALRNPYTDPLNLLQAELLQRARAGGTVSPALHRALLVTIAGIAAGMRNTG